MVGWHFSSRHFRQKIDEIKLKKINKAIIEILSRTKSTDDQTGLNRNNMNNSVKAAVKHKN